MATATSKRQATKSSSSVVPKVYSYIRFSTPEQAKGGSEERQDDGARRYAKEIGLPFDEMLHMADYGKSAHHAVHISKGVFGVFLHCIKTGKVAKGSVLVVESIDRVSRQNPVKAIRTILFDIIADGGVSIYCLDSSTLYDANNADNQILELFGEINRAYRESKRKSQLLKAAREQERKRRRETGLHLTKDGEPTKGHREWRVNNGGKLKIIPEAGRAICKMFQMKRKGVGNGTITRYLNEHAAWSPPPKQKKGAKKGVMVHGWGESYVNKILKDRAVIGEVQEYTRRVDELTGKRIREKKGEPYIVPELDVLAKYPGLFDRVQEINLENEGKANGGANGKATNLLQKLVTCAYCGGPMNLYDKSHDCKYLKCRTAVDAKRTWNKAKKKRGKKRTAAKLICEPHSIRYDEVEELILTSCPLFRLDQVLPRPDERSKLCYELTEQIELAEAQDRDVNHRIANLKAGREEAKTKEERDDIRNQLSERKSQLAALETKLKSLKSDLSKVEHDAVSFVDWQQSIETLKTQIFKRVTAPPDAKTGKQSTRQVYANVELRQQLNRHLKSVIERIEVFPIGYKSADDDTFGDEFDDVFDGVKDAQKFISWVVQRRMTKEGRFVRLHFKNGRHFDLVPKGSLASGVAAFERRIDRDKDLDDKAHLISGDKQLDRQEPQYYIEFTSPNIEQLEREFTAKPRKPR